MLLSSPSSTCSVFREVTCGLLFLLCPLSFLSVKPLRQVYRGLLTQLREEMLSRIDLLSPEQYAFLSTSSSPSSMYLFCRLLLLLDESFPYISFPELRAIPMKVIRTLKSVPRAFLVELSKDEKYYADAPLEVLLPFS